MAFPARTEFLHAQHQLNYYVGFLAYTIFVPFADPIQVSLKPFQSELIERRTRSN
jgi:hypothetical protein